MKWARLSLVSWGENGGSGKLSGGLLERHVQPRRTLQRAASLRGQRGCSYRAAWQAAINHALDRVRVMLGARFPGSVANQGIWRLTASRPKQPSSIPVPCDWLRTQKQTLQIIHTIGVDSVFQPARVCLEKPGRFSLRLSAHNNAISMSGIALATKSEAAHCY